MSEDSAKSAVPERDRSRPYDVVVFGATGFTGKLVADYLADRYADSDLRWALAGRSREKLEAVQSALAERVPAAAELDVLVADSADRASLDDMVAKASVVCTTVGPYAQYGSELVAACVTGGADYCDLTGEVQWIRRMIDAHHDEAERTGVRIVHCCGYDCIPSDLGTLLVQKTAQEQFGAYCDRVTLFVDGASGSFSGGTYASILGVFREVKDPEVRRVLGHPYSLCPPGEREGPDGSDQMGVRYDRDGEAWTGPFMMAATNTRMVRRTHALLGHPWGRGFRYAEKTRLKKGPFGLFKAVGMTAGLGAFAMALAFPPTRALLTRTVLPSPGEGPSPEKIERGFFKMTLVGRRDDDGSTVRVEVRGRRDPGYGATAAMLSESALCLALDGARLDSGGGVLTPASAMGMTLVDRLNASGVVTLEVV